MTRIRNKIFTTCFFALIFMSSFASANNLDFNGNGVINLADAISVLKAATGSEPEQCAAVGIEKAVHILHILINKDIDAYETDDTSDQANLIFINDEVQRHNFHDAGDVDWLMFYGVEGESYTVEASNMETRCDVMIKPYCPDGDGMKEPTSGTRTWKCDEEGMYYAKLTNANSDHFGEDTGYDLKVYIPNAPFASGAIVGYVCDASSDNFTKTVDDVTITCKKSDGNERHVYQNSSIGIYYVFGLEEGTYTLSAQADGYTDFPDTEVEVGSITIRKDICMEPFSE